MTRAALAKVSTGWAGSIAVTFGGVTTTVTPRTRESCISIAARLAADTYVDSGLSLVFAALASDQWQATGSAAFSMALAGGINTSLDFDSGPYSGASSYISDANGITGLYTPLYGLRLDGTEVATDSGHAVSSGVSGDAGLVVGARTSLHIWTDYADAWDREVLLLGVYDVFHDGRVFGRVRIDGWRRTAMGKRRDVGIELVADAQVVSE